MRMFLCFRLRSAFRSAPFRSPPGPSFRSVPFCSGTRSVHSVPFRHVGVFRWEGHRWDPLTSENIFCKEFDKSPCDL